MTHTNVLEVQTWNPETNCWDTIDFERYQGDTCPEIDLDPIDVGAGTYRLCLRDEDGDVLDVTEDITYFDPACI